MGVVYSKIKVFHYPKKIDSLPRDNKLILAPISVRIKPTNICNHRCCYCAYRQDNLQLGKNMVADDQIPREKILEIIDDLISMGIKSVVFSGGGEPLCYPYLLETINKLAKGQIQFGALTNGSLLYQDIAEVFSKKGTWIRVSLDGWDDESYSRYRGVALGEFTKVINNMFEFKKKNGQCYLGVNLIVDQDNADHIYELVSRIKDVGVNSVKISRRIVFDDDEKNNAYHRDFFVVARKNIDLVRQKLASSSFEVLDSYREVENSFKKEYDWCPYLQILPVIGADLNVYSCQDKAYNLKHGFIGTIKDKRFKDFWFLEKDKFFKINPSRVCNHHCVANEKNKIVLDYLNIDKNHIGFV